MSKDNSYEVADSAYAGPVIIWSDYDYYHKLMETVSRVNRFLCDQVIWPIDRSKCVRLGLDVKVTAHPGITLPSFYMGAYVSPMSLCETGGYVEFLEQWASEFLTPGTTLMELNATAVLSLSSSPNTAVEIKLTVNGQGTVTISFIDSIYGKEILQHKVATANLRTPCEVVSFVANDFLAAVATSLNVAMIKLTKDRTDLGGAK